MGGRGSASGRGGGGGGSAAKMTAIENSVKNSYIGPFTSQNDAKSGYWMEGLKREINREAFMRDVEITMNQVDSVARNIVDSLPTQEELERKYRRR